MERNALNKLRGHPGIVQLYTTFQVEKAPPHVYNFFTHIKQAMDEKMNGSEK